MKKTVITFSIIAFALTGCLKDKPNVDFSGDKPVVDLLYPAGAGNQGIGSGLNFFSGGALTFPSSDVSDTLTFMANMNSVNPLNTDVVVTIGVQPAMLTVINADTVTNSSKIQYDAMPDSDYTILNTTATIAAGQRLATFKVVVYPSKIDGSKSYMAPIGITDASGQIVAANFSTVFMHSIGNPIAGNYEQYWSRWNDVADTTSGEAGALYYKYDVGPVTFSPNNPTEIAVGSQGTGETDIIDFENNAGVLSNFTAAWPEPSAQYGPDLGLISISDPKMVVADPVHGYYYIFFTYVNSAGAKRAIVNEYVKQ